MVDPDTNKSTIDVAADLSGEKSAEAFSLLGNQTRLAILLALWEAAEPFTEGTWDPRSEENLVPFSKLRERVGVADPGQFNYHLGQLEGNFVEHTSDGYRLSPAGDKIVRTVIAFGGFGKASLAPTEIDWACWHCGAQTAITFQNQRLYWVCTACEGNLELGDRHPSGALASYTAHSSILSHQTSEAILLARKRGTNHDFAMFQAEICPSCLGQVEPSLHVCETHDSESDGPCPACGRRVKCAARFVCTICQKTGEVAVQSLSEVHTAVLAFFWNIGIDTNSLDMETIRRLEDLREDADQKLFATEPPRVRVTFRHKGDEIQLAYDEELNVVEVKENY